MEHSLIIGNNINKIRNQKNLTLNVLSERSGVSKAMLSQIETNKVNPTVATVWKIAQGLGVELNDVITYNEDQKKTFLVRKDYKHTEINNDKEGIFITVLSPLYLVEDLEVYKIKLKPESTLESKPHIPGTQEFLTILSGSVEVKAADNVTLLKKGDAIHYDSDVEHSIKNIGNKEAKIHMVVRYKKFTEN